MAQLQSTMASLPLVYNYTAVFEAIDPDTGDPVPGVIVVDPSVYGVNLSAQPATTPAAGPSQLIPLDELPDGTEPSS
jgi:hypothetical protein